MTATYVLIAAAGRGERFNTEGPCLTKGTRRNKVFELLLGRPILRWTVDAYAAIDSVDGIVVVAGANEVAEFRDILSGAGKVMAILPGGENRQESVFIGLSTLAGEDESLIAVHDGARPLIDAATIERCLSAARGHGNAVAAVPVTDTLKAAGPGNVVQRTVERDGLYAVQTPQIFRWRTLAEAHVAARDSGFVGTDEASLVEQFGTEPIHLVPGSGRNIKITRPEDLPLAEAILRARMNPPNGGPSAQISDPIINLGGSKAIDGEHQPTYQPAGEGAHRSGQTRVGFGYDVHRFAAGRRLFLGGVEFETGDGMGLDGHSDADVLLHAICDALLGAAALPDIGNLFPNTDPAYLGISSLRLLEQVRARLMEDGWTIGNVDSTVIAERPKIAPAIPQMRDAIARALCIDPQCVGIKATTNEGLGSIGDGMGIAAHAVASVFR